MNLKNLINENRLKYSTLISLLYLTGKFMVAIFENRYGFIITSVGSALAYYKFKKLDEKEKSGELANVELGTIVVFTIAFFLYRGKDYELTFFEQVSVYSIGGLLSLVYLGKTIKGIKSIDKTLQNISVFFFILGPTFVICKIGYGWIGYMIAHTLMAKIQLRLEKKDYAFAVFQGISFVIAFIGLIFYIYGIKP